MSAQILFLSFLEKKKKKERKKTQPAAGVNGAYGQCSQIPRERRGLELCSRTVIKHDLVSKLICNAELNIWWCTVFFFLCPISFIENGAVSLDGKAVTMTDAFPGGRSAVAKILGGWGEDSRRFQRPQMWSDATVYLECKERVFPLVWRARPPGTLACVHSIRLTFWSWLCSPRKNTHIHESDVARWYISQKHRHHTLFRQYNACKCAQK